MSFPYFAVGFLYFAVVFFILLWFSLFYRKFPLSCRGFLYSAMSFLYFAVSFFILTWFSLFCRKLSLFCREFSLFWREFSLFCCVFSSFCCGFFYSAVVFSFCRETSLFCHDFVYVVINLIILPCFCFSRRDSYGPLCGFLTFDFEVNIDTLIFEITTNLKLSLQSKGNKTLLKRRRSAENDYNFWKYIFYCQIVHSSVSFNSI